ncbi:MAG: Hpt domain-containing protein [Acetobacteraceae bacterium]|nr:Hpt domain-containing protein [Acetobacteraceae bacterium]
MPRHAPPPPADATPPPAKAMTIAAQKVAKAIDRSVLREWFGNDDDGIDTLLAEFRDSTYAEHTKMLAALAAGDIAEYGQAVHRLRGAALSVGANGLARAAAVLDTAARAKDIATCRSGMPALEVQLGQMAADVPASNGATSKQ